MHDLAGGKSPTDILQFIEGMAFPVKKDELIRVVRHNGAPEDILGALTNLPSTDIASKEQLIELYPRLVEQTGRRHAAVG